MRRVSVTVNTACYATVLLLILSTLSKPLMAREVVLTPTDDHRKALQQLRPGDEVVLTAGEWRDVVLKIEATGTAQQPILIRAETSGETIFTGNSQLAFSGQHVTVQGLHFRDITSKSEIIQFRTHSERLATHYRLTNCVITNQLAPSGKEEQRWVSVYGTDNRVDHCFFQGKQTKGALLVVWVTDEENRHRLDHNHFGQRPPLGGNGGETIRIGTSDVSLNVSRTVVEQNLFEKCDGESEIISNKSCANVYRRNTFLSCSGTLTLRHGNDCRVEQNYFLGRKARGSGGVRMIGKGHLVVNNYFAELEGDEIRSALSFMNGIENTPLNGYAQVHDCVVAFNTIIDCKVAMTVGVEASRKQPLVPQNCTVANNVFVGRRNEIREHVMPEAWIRGGDVTAKSTDELKFSKDEFGIWRPSAMSSVVAAAATVANLTTMTDIDGDTRLVPMDVGCDQQGNRKSGPLNANDVGPDWLPAESR